MAELIGALLGYGMVAAVALGGLCLAVCLLCAAVWAVVGPVLVTAWAIRKTDEMLSQAVPGRRMRE